MKNKVSIEWYDELDSTNTEVLRRMDSLDSYAVIAAANQTAGRGQRGNSWNVQKGMNLTFSLLLKFRDEEFTASEQFLLSEASALAVHDYLSARSIETSIKWPNDIYYRNKKLCGMLIENATSGKCLASSIIGIGLNVNQKEFPAGLVNPISMSQITNKTYSLKEELEILCTFLSKRLELPLERDLNDEYAACIYRKNEFHEYVDCASGATFKGEILGVSNEGKLRVKTEKGELKEFAFKEISYII